MHVGNPLRPHYTVKTTEARKEDVAVERRRRGFPLGRPARRRRRPATSLEAALLLPESDRARSVPLLRAKRGRERAPNVSSYPNYHSRGRCCYPHFTGKKSGLGDFLQSRDAGPRRSREE